MFLSYSPPHFVQAVSRQLYRNLTKSEADEKPCLRLHKISKLLQIMSLSIFCSTSFGNLVDLLYFFFEEFQQFPGLNFAPDEKRFFSEVVFLGGHSKVSADNSMVFHCGDEYANLAVTLPFHWQKRYHAIKFKQRSVKKNLLEP